MTARKAKTSANADPYGMTTRKATAKATTGVLHYVQDDELYSRL
jgi:hypothetical protein